MCWSDGRPGRAREPWSGLGIRLLSRPVLTKQVGDGDVLVEGEAVPWRTRLCVLRASFSEHRAFCKAI